MAKHSLCMKGLTRYFRTSYDKNSGIFVDLFIKVEGLRFVTLLKMAPAEVFSSEFWEIFKKSYFTEHLRVTASECEETTFL